MNEELDLLKEAHREPLEESHYTALRARVMERVREERRPSVWWWAWLAAATAIAAVAIMLWPRAAVVAPLPQVAIARPPAPALPVATVRRAVHRAKRKPKGAEPGKPMMVKLLTGDPNIVIYLIIGKQGD